MVKGGSVFVEESLLPIGSVNILTVPIRLFP